MDLITKKRFSMLEASGMIAVAVLCVAALAYAVTVPHTFVNGTVADADQVNANFNALVTCEAIVNDNFSIPIGTEPTSTYQDRATDIRWYRWHSNKADINNTIIQNKWERFRVVWD